jgi:co-chaperonin GroES (HSP10)
VTNESGFTPNGDLVLVLPPKIVDKSPGGIVLPQATKDKEQQATRLGRVVAMGDDAREHPRMKGISEGDMVLFPRYVQDKLPVNGDLYFIMRADQVLGLMTKLPDYEMNAARSSTGVFGYNDPQKAA